MKSNDLVTILAGGILAFVAYKVLGPSLSGSSGGSSWVSKITANTSGADNPAYGWQYFSDGTSIAPNGDYYYQGKKVWSATP